MDNRAVFSSYLPNWDLQLMRTLSSHSERRALQSQATSQGQHLAWADWARAEEIAKEHKN